MNYLAHIYLSGENEFLKIGNFMADHIKGKRYLEYDEDIQKGILLHRQIDSFTDRNPIVRKSKRRLHDRYGLYRGIVIDIFYDHMLAKNWDDYASVSLNEYSRGFYELLRRNFEVLPERVQYLSNYMIRQDWLSSYAEIDGIQQVLNGMDRRTSQRSGMRMASEDLQKHYADFERDFKLFFEKLRNFSAEKLEDINNQYI